MTILISRQAAPHILQQNYAHESQSESVLFR